MSVIHRITGYNRRTERLEVEYDIPRDRLTEIRAVAQIPSSDTDAINPRWGGAASRRPRFPPPQGAFSPQSDRTTRLSFRWRCACNIRSRT
jgi:hypothetical protein